MPAIVLVRHAQASFGAADYDVLSDLGHEQVAAVAQALDRRGMPVARIVSGSLRRQRDTAAAYARIAGVDVDVDPRWNEYVSDAVLTHHAQTDARLEGGTVSSREFQPLLEAALVAWIQAGDASPAEVTWPAFADGIRAALQELGTSLGSGETAVVFTSGGPIAAICARLLGCPPEALVTFNRVAINTGVTKIAVGRGGMTLVSFSEHEHLEGDAARLLTYR